MATRADQRKFHYIYKITRFDGKYYIGMHSTDDLDDGYFGSGQLLWKSIKKHGKEKHSKEILEFFQSREELKSRERELVNEEIVNDQRCMNLKLGGEGGWDHFSWKGKVRSSEHVRRLQESHSKAMSIRNQVDPSLIAARIVGCRKAASAESSAKRSSTMKERGHMQGEKNSQFGTCWVTNGVKPIKIKKEELEQYLLAGWSKGRKILTTD